MRFSKLLTGAAAAAMATGLAAAQPTGQPSAEKAPPPEEESLPRLGDLEATVDELVREESQPSAQQEEAPAPSPEQGAPAEGAASEPEMPAAEAPAPAEPAAETPAPPAPPLTRRELAEVERVAERGRVLIALARAGIIATQDMLSRVSDPEGAGIAGWIAEPAGNAMLVTFYAAGGESEAAGAVYRATVLGGRVTSREVFLSGERPALGPVQARMAAARAATESEELRACSGQPFNVLVVPPASPDEPVDVYRLSTPAERGRFPLGGHYRATVAADGSVAESRGFTNACLDAEAPAAGEGEAAAPIGVVHLLDPMPTEVHMFLSQMIGRPLLVATGEPQRVWLVTNERIAEVRP